MLFQPFENNPAGKRCQSQCDSPKKRSVAHASGNWKWIWRFCRESYKVVPTVWRKS